MRFRPRRILTYLLIGISVVVVLANFISYNNTTQLLDDGRAQQPQPPPGMVLQDALLGPHRPNPVFFDERFRKYDDNPKTNAKDLPVSSFSVSPSVGGVGGAVGSVTRHLAGLPNSSGGPAGVSAFVLPPPSVGERATYNGSLNEEHREQFVRRVRWSEASDGDPNQSVWVPKTNRRHEIVDDRIVRQMSFVPRGYGRSRTEPLGSVSPSVRLKTIYVPSGVDAETPLGQLKFVKDKCPVSACNITTDSVYESTADLRLLQADAYFSSAERKPPGQIWAIWVLESPANTVDFAGPDDLINWTATYRWDSTLVTPYAKFVPFSSDVAEAGEAAAAAAGGHRKVNHAANKTKMVAWFVSNCNAKNRRWEFAQELNKYIPVDIFGACGTIDCPRSAQADCNERLNADYKFYLSFENSNCDYYVTEKFFENGLGNDVVPIVMGGRKADYLKAAPPNSYIHVDDFDSVEELATYLLKLNASDELYNEYFRWKGSGEFINTKFWCRLCALLNDDQRPLMWYTKFHRWWLHDGACTTDRWEE